MRLTKDRASAVVDTRYAREMLEASDRAQAGNPESEQVWLLLVDEIAPDPDQPRRHFDTLALQELAEDIQQRGVLEPILVMRHGRGYRIIVGERRWRASKIAGNPRIPCIIREMEPEAIQEAQLVENVLRQGLNDVERGMALRRLYETLKERDRDTTWEKVAARVGLSRMRIHHLHSLSLLPERVVELIQSRRLSGSHGVELARLHDYPETMVALAETASRPSDGKGPYALTVNEIRERINEALLTLGNQNAVVGAAPAAPAGLRRIPSERLERRARELALSVTSEVTEETRSALLMCATEILRVLGVDDAAVKSTLQMARPGLDRGSGTGADFVKSTLHNRDRDTGEPPTSPPLGEEKRTDPRTYKNTEDAPL